MTLAPGAKLGPYEIVAPLGAGGMGEVYRARDTRLGREVAIKALPPAFAQDPERLARFEREAKLLASLNHPNVAGIHGLEVVEGHRYLILELVEGESLAERLSRGALGTADTIEVCRQIAAGVEAAHEAGVVHRDLKPANVMLRPDGTVKVLDFGLAKGGAAHGAASGDPSLSASPTMTYAMTSAGMILGTAAYMSPEQARGRNVDRRTDVWSFGCVLYECLSGRRAFEGDTVSDMVARILEREPDWAALPQTTPVWLRDLLQRCLAKDAKQRLQAIGEARIALERGDAIAVTAPAPTPFGNRFAWLPWALAGVLGLALLVTAVMTGLSAKPTPMRSLELGFPAQQTQLIGVAISFPILSPDGRQVAVVARDAAGVERTWVRSLDRFEFRMLKGTEGVSLPFWSPDSRELGFISGGSLRRISVADGSIQKLADGVFSQRGGDWGRNQSILYTPSTNGSIWRVPASGGTPVQVTQLDTTLVDASHRFPVWLPDGKHFLFALWSNNARVLTEVGGIYLSSVDGMKPRRILSDVGSFLVLRSGHLVAYRNRGLVAVPFDLRSFEVGNPAAQITEQVAFQVGAGIVGASASGLGDLAYTTPADLPMTDLAWLDRTGQAGNPLGVRTKFESVTLSPDASQAVGHISDATGMSQLWSVDLARRTVSRVTRDENDSFSPVWSPDGTRIAFNNMDSGTQDIYVQLAGGTRPKERIWTANEVDAELTDWSADGRLLFFRGSSRSATASGQIWVADMGGDSVRALLQDDFEQGAATLSPDGRWLAYASWESGTPEIYVRSFPDLERKWQVSVSGGERPHWRKDSRELLFERGPIGDREVWAVDVTPSAQGFAVGEPHALFKWPANVIALSATRDHSRFLALVQPEANVMAPMRVLLNWNGGRTK